MEKKRIIFHVDVNNAFLSWTAVDLLKKGYSIDIRNIPAVIGGDERKRSGIVLAKSPVAKKYGIVTAETLYSARKKCPMIKVFSPNFEVYYEKSNLFYNYLTQYTPLIERFSVDECFLDMTGTNYLYQDYLELAYKIKNEIKEKFGFTVNVGVANNKLCAKMASDFEKPDKVHTLFDDEIENKMWPLPVGDLFMVGKSTAQLLNKLKINTIGDLAHTDMNKLKKYFKNQASFLKNSALGIDFSKVEIRSNKRDSISVSETLPYDVVDIDELKEVLLRQTEEVGRQLRRQKEYAGNIAIIFKNNLFQTYSHQTTLNNVTDSNEEIYKCILDLLEVSWKKDPIRLIGMRLGELTDKRNNQLSLFDEYIEEEEKDTNIQKILDDINEKYGDTSIMPASVRFSKFKKRPKKKK